MNEYVEKWRIRAAEWLDLQEAADILNETKNDVFAEIKSAQDGSSEAEKERKARLSPEWKEFRDKMLDADAKARRARLRVKYESMLFDAWRTENANARTEKIHG
jgi:hypothetical protein